MKNYLKLSVTFKFSNVRITAIGLLLLSTSIFGCTSSQKLAGEWEYKYPSPFGKSTKIILTPEGKVYFIPQKEYPKIKVALDIPLEKISDKTSLPSDTKIISIKDFVKQQAHLTKHLEGVNFISSMNRRQQAYFSENAKFAQNLKDLGFSMRWETPNYTYEIVSQSNPQSVMNVAQAKDKGLNNHIGLLYVTRVKENSIIIKKVCGTSQHLTQLPQIPKLPENAATSEDIKCPSGFESLHMPKFYKNAS